MGQSDEGSEMNWSLVNTLKVCQFLTGTTKMLIHTHSYTNILKYKICTYISLLFETEIEDFL